MPDETLTTASMRRTRIRTILERRFYHILVGLVILGIVASGVVYLIHINPAIETEEQTVSTWNEQTSVSHQAGIVRPNLVFDEDQTLRNQPVYFAHLSPELEGIHEYTYSATGEGELDVTSSAALQLLSTSRDGTVYWERTEPLVEQHAQLAPGERTRAAVEINVSDAVQQIDRIQASVDSTVGTAEIVVVFDTYVRGTVNGESVANRHRDSFSIEPSGSTYNVVASGGSQERHTETEIVEAAVTYGAISSYTPFGILGGSFLGIVGLVTLRHRELLGPSPVALAALERHQQRAEFADWISTGEVPDEVLGGTRIELQSLTDLVDVAIDTNQRVLEDTTRDAFYVLTGDWYYTCRPIDAGQTKLDSLAMTPRRTGNGGKKERIEIGQSRPPGDSSDRVSSRSPADDVEGTTDGDGHTDGSAK